MAAIKSCFSSYFCFLDRYKNHHAPRPTPEPSRVVSFSSGDPAHW